MTTAKRKDVKRDEDAHTPFEKVKTADHKREKEQDRNEKR